MTRTLQLLALITALAVAAAAFIELADRGEDDQIALPTTVPSPSVLAPTEEPTEAPTDEPTEEPTPERSASQATQAGEAPTRAPTPSQTQDEATVAPATATPTAAPPRTPTPEPLGTAGPVTQAQGRTPRTGGESLPAGVTLAALALVLRALLLRRRHSY